MIHRFIVDRIVPGSLPNALANYLDMEHLVFHNELDSVDVIEETYDTATLLTTAKFWIWSIKLVGKGRFVGCSTLVQVVQTPIGEIEQVVEFYPANNGENTQIVTNISIDLPFFIYPIRKMIEKRLQASATKVAREDVEILARRKKLFGASIQDYLRTEQHLLFKRKFAACYGA